MNIEDVKVGDIIKHYCWLYKVVQVYKKELEVDIQVIYDIKKQLRINDDVIFRDIIKSYEKPTDEELRLVNPKPKIDYMSITRSLVGG